MERKEGLLLQFGEIRERSQQDRSGDSLGIDDGTQALPFWMEPIDSRFELAFSVRINGDPHGKGSVRVIDFEDKKSGKIKKRGVQAPKSRIYENQISKLVQFQKALNGFLLPLDGPLIIRVLTVQKRPKTIPKKLRLPVDPIDPIGRMFCAVKPDWDNLGKSIGDGLKKGGAVSEDSRIVDGRVVTLYGRSDEKPFLEAYVWGLRP